MPVRNVGRKIWISDKTRQAQATAYDVDRGPDDRYRLQILPLKRFIRCIYRF